MRTRSHTLAPYPSRRMGRCELAPSSDKLASIRSHATRPPYGATLQPVRTELRQKAVGIQSASLANAARRSAGSPDTEARQLLDVASIQRSTTDSAQRSSEPVEPGAMRLDLRRVPSPAPPYGEPPTIKCTQRLQDQVGPAGGLVNFGCLRLLRLRLRRRGRCIVLGPVG